MTACSADCWTWSVAAPEKAGGHRSGYSVRAMTTPMGLHALRAWAVTKTRQNG
jgi:hypothetical protein